MDKFKQRKALMLEPCKELRSSVFFFYAMILEGYHFSDFCRRFVLQQSLGGSLKLFSMFLLKDNVQFTM